MINGISECFALMWYFRVDKLQCYANSLRQILQTTLFLIKTSVRLFVIS